MLFALQYRDLDGSTLWFTLNGEREVYYSMPRAKSTANRLNDELGSTVYKAVPIDDEEFAGKEDVWDELEALRKARLAEKAAERNRIIDECIASFVRQGFAPGSHSVMILRELKTA